MVQDHQSLLLSLTILFALVLKPLSLTAPTMVSISTTVSMARMLGPGVKVCILVLHKLHAFFLLVHVLIIFLLAFMYIYVYTLYLHFNQASEHHFNQNFFL